MQSNWTALISTLLGVLVFGVTLIGGVYKAIDDLESKVTLLRKEIHVDINENTRMINGLIARVTVIETDAKHCSCVEKVR